MNKSNALKFRIPVLILAFVAIFLRIFDYTVSSYRLDLFGMLVFSTYILLAVCAIALNSSRIILPIIFIITAAVYASDFQYLRPYNIEFWLFAISIVILVLAALNCFIRFSKKLYYIAPALGIIVHTIFFIMQYINSLIRVGNLATLAFFIGLFILGLNKKYFIAAIPSAKAKTSEEKLKLLKENFDSGKISKEEYEEKRAEVISKL